MIEQYLEEYTRCETNFYEFLKYVKIVETPTPKTPGGVRSFELWPHLIECIEAFRKHQLVVVLKARQIGISWLLAAWNLWDALFKEGATLMLFSKGEDEAIELLGKSKRIYEHLPDWMKRKKGSDSATEVFFPNLSSRLKAFAATESAGISYTATRLTFDEWEQHPYAQANYIQAKPTIDAGGQLIGVFTVDTSKPDTLAKKIFKEAYFNQSNGFKALFFPYNVRPGRDDKWYEDVQNSIPEMELAGLTREIYMWRNYPRSVEEALSPTQTEAAFDLKVIEGMKEDCRSSISYKLIDKYDIDPKTVNVYKDYNPSDVYLAASDTAHGVGKDFSVTVVMNVRTKEVVADIMHNRLGIEEFAFHSVQMLKVYHNPRWWPEDNDWGKGLIDHAQRMGYRNWGYQDKGKTRIGFHTNDPTRTALFSRLIPWTNSRQWVCYNINGLKQFSDIQRNAAKEGKIEATQGRNDDYPMAVGICLLKCDEVPLRTGGIEPIRTLTFDRPVNLIHKRQEPIKSLTMGR